MSLHSVTKEIMEQNTKQLYQVDKNCDAAPKARTTDIPSANRVDLRRGREGRGWVSDFHTESVTVDHDGVSFWRIPRSPYVENIICKIRVKLDE